MSYKTAVIARQQILDYLNAQPEPMLAAEIMAATGIHKHIWRGCTKTMREHREIEQVGKGKTSKYRARVVTTITIEALKEHSSHAAAATVAGKPPKTAPRGYVHKAGHYDAPGHVQGRPLKNQNAQGSGRRTVFVGSVG